MEYVDLHAHMVSRTTDDYRAMAMSGCVAVTEPAFWAGYDRPARWRSSTTSSGSSTSSQSARRSTESLTTRGCA